MKKRRLASPPLEELAILLLVVGAAILGVAVMQRHPPFTSLQETQGRLDAVESIRSGRYHRQPLFVIEGRRYVYRGLARAAAPARARGARTP